MRSKRKAKGAHSGGSEFCSVSLPPVAFFSEATLCTSFNMVLYRCLFWFQPDAKGPRPEPLRQKEKEGKDPDAYDKMNALSLVRMEVQQYCTAK